MDNRTSQGLEYYKLSGVRVTDREPLGRGSYATVLELEYMGLKCAGKKIHEVLLEQGGASYSVRRFEEECCLLSQVRHPNVVQFLGVHFQHGVPTPILVMEFLPTNLASCIEKYGILAKEISYSILYDVALGLHYLHSQTPPIIHRDLSANNVLLTPYMTAKIGDLGVARILNLTPLQLSHLTQTPGTPAYMPPEVMVANPKYNECLDVFSYGILMIHMFSGTWPEPQIGQNQIVEDNHLIPVTEAERREVFLRKVGNDHPLMDLILRCINNNAQARAKTTEIVERLKDMVLQFEGSLAFDDRLKMFSRIQDQDQEIRALTENLEITGSDNTKLKKEIRDIRISLNLTKEQLNLKEQDLDLERSLREKHCLQITAKKQALKKKNEIISKLSDQLTTAREYLSSEQQDAKARIRWKPLKDLPETVIAGEATVISGKVYVAGQASTSVYCYQPSEDNWTTLPPLPVKSFGLGQVNGKLVAVGGRMERNGIITNELYTYKERDRKWRQKIPPLPTARFDPGVLSLQSALVVAGGEIEDMTYTEAVEVLRVGERPDVLQWCKTDPLPVACSKISMVITDDKCYAIGGHKVPSYLNHALFASVENLLSNAMPVDQTNSTSNGGNAENELACKTLPNTISFNPATAILAGNIFSLGGWGDSAGGDRKKNVYVYSSSIDSWIYIGASDFPVPLACAIVAVVSCSQIIVIGGIGRDGIVKTVYSGMLTVDL